jgi:hypothetical protein
MRGWRGCAAGTQAADIKQAKKYWADYQQRVNESEEEL